MKATSNLLIILLLLVGCSKAPSVAGGGTDVSNPFIVGVAKTSEGAYADGAIAELIPVAYSPIEQNEEILTDTIGSDGLFSFEVDSLDRYNLIIRYEHSLQGVLVDSIVSSASDSLNISLQPYGSVAVQVPDSLVGGVLYFEGTDVSVAASTDSVRIADLPVGTLPKLVGVNGGKEEIIEDEVRIVSGVEIIVPYTFSVLMVGIDSVSDMRGYLDLASETGGMPIQLTTTLSSEVTKYDAVYLTYTSELSSAELAVLRNAAVPVICSRADYLDSLGMVIAGKTGYETWNSVIVKSEDHPIINGVFTPYETIDLYETSYKTEPILTWGEPWGNADYVMVGVKDQGMAMVYTYESGKPMHGLNAPARRAGLTLTQIEGMTENGETLFKRVLLWAVGEL